MPGDPENVWLLAKREDLSNEEAGRALWKNYTGNIGIRKAGKTRCEKVPRDVFPNSSIGWPVDL